MSSSLFSFRLNAPFFECDIFFMCPENGRECFMVPQPCQWTLFPSPSKPYHPLFELTLVFLDNRRFYFDKRKFFELSENQWSGNFWENYGNLWENFWEGCLKLQTWKNGRLKKGFSCRHLLNNRWLFVVNQPAYPSETIFRSLHDLSSHQHHSETFLCCAPTWEINFRSAFYPSPFWTS